jgi:signal peptidase II
MGKNVNTRNCFNLSCLKLRNNVLWMGIGIAIIIILLDQISKLLISQKFAYEEIKPILPSIALTLRHNSGAAFSFLADASGWQRWFFVFLALFVSGTILIWLKNLNAHQKLEALGLSFILGGALGNLWDRLQQGYVIDFILLYYKEWEWPAFNIADSAIFIGVILFIITLFRKNKHD